MSPDERLAAALAALGPGAKVVRRKKPLFPRRRRFPQARKRGHGMTRSEYEQCGKKDRYSTEHEARKLAAKLSALRGYPIRAYGPCWYCGGWHLTHRPSHGDGGEGK